MKRCPNGKRRIGRICKRKPTKAKKGRAKRKPSRYIEASRAAPKMTDAEWDKFTREFNDNTPESFWSENGKIRHNRDGGKPDPAWNGYRGRSR
jgi:hypothetical protein